jgi:hypothetical protein
MTPEHKLMDDVRIACGKKGMIVVRMNVGTFLDPHDGKPINTGIPVGFPDLMVLCVLPRRARVLHRDQGSPTQAHRRPAPRAGSVEEERVQGLARRTRSMRR